MQTYVLYSSSPDGVCICRPVCFAALGLVALTVCVYGDAQADLVRLARQMKMQQLFAEERIRSGGNSGLKQVRQMNRGTRPYYQETHSGNRNVMTIHDHSNYVFTVGEYSTVLQYNTLQYSTVQYSTEQYSTVRRSAPHRTVPYRTVLYCTIQYYIIGFRVGQCGGVERSPPHFTGILYRH